MDRLDRGRFPSVASYLDRLPGGLAAYPDLLCKASLLRSILDDFRLEGIVAGLPDSLAELVRHPPPAADWISEVHFRALMRAIADEFFRDQASFVAWTYGAQRRLLSGPLYRVMFALMNPERIAKLSQSRWASFHRGTTLSLDISPGQGIATLTYPPHSYDALDHQATMAGFRVALELLGLRQIESAQLEVGTTQARSRFSWR